MTLLGQTRQDLPFTVCSKFQPTVLEGQLCYYLNISKITKVESGFDKEHSLIMVLDPAKSELDLGHVSQYMPGSNIVSLNMASKKTLYQSPRIYVHTLAGLFVYQAGGYALSSLKKMTATKGFLRLPEEAKECETEAFEKCQTRKFITEVQNQCGCIPWTLSSMASSKVRINSTAGENL